MTAKQSSARIRELEAQVRCFERDRANMRLILAELGKALGIGTADGDYTRIDIRFADSAGKANQ